MNKLNLRIIHTHDTEAKWLEKSSFIPQLGEIIVYDKDLAHAYQRFKIGDGVSTVNELPFTVDTVIQAMFNFTDNMLIADGGRID